MSQAELDTRPSGSFEVGKKYKYRHNFKEVRECVFVGSTISVLKEQTYEIAVSNNTFINWVEYKEPRSCSQKLLVLYNKKRNTIFFASANSKRYYQSYSHKYDILDEIEVTWTEKV